MNRYLIVIIFETINCTRAEAGAVLPSKNNSNAECKLEKNFTSKKKKSDGAFVLEKTTGRIT